MLRLRILLCNVTRKLYLMTYFVLLDSINYNPFLVYCRELAPGTVSLTGDRAQGDDSKYDLHYNDFTG